MSYFMSLFFLQAVHLGHVATISSSDLSAGQKWHWNYFDAAGAMYSSEQYEVLENNNDVILIEMSSHFPGETVYKPHHRIEIPLEDCLRSYSDPLEKKPWSMRMFYLDNGKWNETEPPSTLAFEEKFNCNPYRHDSREYLTVFKTSPMGEAFAQKRWRTQESSWFMNSGNHAAVVYEKDFPHGAGGETYHMRLSNENEEGT